MSQQDLLKASRNAWKNSQGIAENARGTSGGLYTLWNTTKIELLNSDTRMHWIHTLLLHKDSRIQVNLINIYLPHHIEEKRICWETLQDFLQKNELDNIILGGDLNVTLIQEEKRGGSIVRDPAKEWVEDIITAWELIDIKPIKGHYTWSNKRLGPGHITARLDRFLVQSSYLTLGFNAVAEILPHSASDNKLIWLEFKSEQGKGPIPFRFNPSWIQDKDFLKIVSSMWTGKFIGSASYVWEEKLRRLKNALKA